MNYMQLYQEHRALEDKAAHYLEALADKEAAVLDMQGKVEVAEKLREQAEKEKKSSQVRLNMYLAKMDNEANSSSPGSADVTAQLQEAWLDLEKVKGEREEAVQERDNLLTKNSELVFDKKRLDKKIKFYEKQKQIGEDSMAAGTTVA